MKQSFLALTAVAVGSIPSCLAFVTPSTTAPLMHTASSSSLGLVVDPSFLTDAMTNAADTTATAATTSTDIASTTSSSLLMSFTDQGKNLAGIFFQASLLPYLLFLYFLSFRANRIPALGNFGFQFVLLFVLSTIPSGILSKSVYGTSLANVDWLHGGAESLLTVANVLIVRIRVIDLGKKNSAHARTCKIGISLFLLTLSTPTSLHRCLDLSKP